METKEDKVQRKYMRTCSRCGKVYFATSKMGKICEDCVVTPSRNKGLSYNSHIKLFENKINGK